MHPTSLKTRLLVALLLWAVTLPIAEARRSSVADPVQPASFQRTALEASGVPAEKLDHYAKILDRLTRTFRATYSAASDSPFAARSRVRAIHAFLHEHVLRGKYEASASDLGVVLDGGPFNCAAASALFLALAAEIGVEAHAVSVRGHVWCRAADSGQTVDVETTCRDWFAIADRHAGLPTAEVSPAMATHRRRVSSGRVLSQNQFLAIFHFNRGVTHLRHNEFAAAARANRLALTLDPDCQPAQENLAAALSSPSTRGQAQSEATSH